MEGFDIIKKIGAGSFSSVYKIKLSSGKIAALKVSDTKKEDIKYSLNEVNILKKFINSHFIVNLLCYEINEDVNNIALEYMDGVLYDIIRFYKKNGRYLPITVVKKFSIQLLHGLHELYRANVVHNDLKPENILYKNSFKNFLKNKFDDIDDKYNFIIYSHLCYNIYKSLETHKYSSMPSRNDLRAHIGRTNEVLMEFMLLNTHLKIGDMGLSISKDQYDINPKCILYTKPTRHYISPEILLNAPYWCSSDMWGLGCIIYEMITGDVLFNPIRDNNMGINSHHIALIIKTFGRIPNNLLEHGKKTDRYFVNGVHKFQYLIGQHQPISFLLKKYYKFSKSEAKSIENFLKFMFEINPVKRITPFNAMKLPFIQ